MSWQTPNAAAFKAQFVRDFNYAPTNDSTNLDYVTDQDIASAITMASANFNPGLFGADAGRTMAFLMLAAFYLVDNLQVSAQGISSKSNFPISSKSAGPVTVSYQIPERYMKDAIISFLTHNGYGMKYLSMALPAIIGNVRVMQGANAPNYEVGGH